MDVLERLVLEDDQSVEAWYLGGWCQYLNAEARRETVNVSNGNANGEQTAVEDIMSSSRKWLLNSLKLYQQLDYEDERLGDHAKELVTLLNNTLGPPPEDGADEEDDGDEEWEDEECDEDQEMGAT